MDESRHKFHVDAWYTSTDYDFWQHFIFKNLFEAIDFIYELKSLLLKNNEIRFNDMMSLLDDKHLNRNKTSDFIGWDFDNFDVGLNAVCKNDTYVWSVTIPQVKYLKKMDSYD